MSALDHDLALAQRHIVEGEIRITRQLLVIAHLREQGLPIREAETLLLRFENTLALMREHERHLRAEDDDDGHA